MTGETTGRQCWEVHKDTVTCIIEKHIKDPALVKRLVDAWDSPVDLGVTTAKASPAQKKKKTDHVIRLTSVRQATSVLLSQVVVATIHAGLDIERFRVHFQRLLVLTLIIVDIGHVVVPRRHVRVVLATCVSVFGVCVCV